MFRKGRKNRRGRDCLQKECICPECRNIVQHERGMPCFQHLCPKCGTPMMGRLTTRLDQ